MDTATKCLKKYWGYDHFRPFQQDIIQAILEGSDTLSLMPTGGGKSLCFQIPALLKTGVCIVISPLISLMMDQVEQLEKRGIKAAALTSAQHKQERKRVLENAVNGMYKLLYISPERLESQYFIDYLRNMDVSFLCVDEAHCIDQWGRDFRPSYQNIGNVRSFLPKLQIAAFTATATKYTRSVIRSQLQLRDVRFFQAPMYRPNLKYAVVKQQDKQLAALRAIKKYGQPGLIYRRSRKACEVMVKWLQRNNIVARAYHAGLPAITRNEVQEGFINNNHQIIVATTAFGMGIDKSDIKQVVHLELPASLEEYVQESGRAGRNGDLSYALCFYDEADVIRLQREQRIKFPEIKEIQQIYHDLANYLALPLGNGKDQSFAFNFDAFSAGSVFVPKQLEYGIKILSLSNYISVSESIFSKTEVRLRLKRDALYSFIEDQQNYADLLFHLIRRYEGIMHFPAHINVASVATKTSLSESEVINQLTELQRLQIIQFKQKEAGSILTFLTERLARKNVRIDPAWYKGLKERATHEMNGMLDYLNTTICRQQFIAHYFDSAIDPCGICDICVAQKKKQSVAHMSLHSILDKLKDRPIPLSSIDVEFPEASRTEVFEQLQLLVEQELIVIKDQKIELL